MTAVEDVVLRFAAPREPADASQLAERPEARNLLTIFAALAGACGVVILLVLPRSLAFAVSGFTLGIVFAVAALLSAYVTGVAEGVVNTPLWSFMAHVATSIGPKSYVAVPIELLLVGFLVGLTLSYLISKQLKTYGADIFVINILGLAVLRELIGPSFVNRSLPMPAGTARRQKPSTPPRMA